MKTTERKVKAWALLSSKGRFLHAITTKWEIALLKEDSHTANLPLVPCTITYSLPITKKPKKTK